MQYKNKPSLLLTAVFLLVTAFSLFSCKNKKAGAGETEAREIMKPAGTPGANNQPDYRLGSFVGAFGASSSSWRTGMCSIRSTSMACSLISKKRTSS